MKRIVILTVLLICLAALACSCDNFRTPDTEATGEGTATSTTLEEIACGTIRTYNFNSFAELEESGKNGAGPNIGYYYLFEDLIEECEPDHITVEDHSSGSPFLGRTFVYYKPTAGGISDTVMLECRYFVDAQNAEKDLDDLKNRGYEPFEYQGKTYYRKDIYEWSGSNRYVTSRELYFSCGNDVIGIRLPDGDRFEDPTDLLKVRKVVCG